MGLLYELVLKPWDRGEAPSVNGIFVMHLTSNNYSQGINVQVLQHILVARPHDAVADGRPMVVSPELDRLDLAALRDSRAREVRTSVDGVMRTWVVSAGLQQT